MPTFSYYKQIIKIYNTYGELKKLNPNHPLLDLLSFRKGCKTPTLTNEFHDRYNGSKTNLSFSEETSRYISDLEEAVKPY